MITVLGVVFLPIIFDGAGYRQLSNIEIDIPEQPRISFDQIFPELSDRDSPVVVTRESVSIDNSGANKGWFIRVAEYDNMDAALNTVKRLGDDGYKASYKMAATEDGGSFLVEVSAGDDRTRARTMAARLDKDYGFKTSLERR